LAKIMAQKGALTGR